MWLLSVIALFCLVIGTVQYRSVSDQQALFQVAEAVDTSNNFGIYAHYSLEAYDANPSYSGVIPSAALALPAWYRPQAGLTAFVANGHLFIFQSQPNAQYAGSVLRDLAKGGGVVGLNIGGTIVSPANVALMAAPVGLPELAVVKVVI